jgi:hypothetical protein
MSNSEPTRNRTTSAKNAKSPEHTPRPSTRGQRRPRDPLSANDRPPAFECLPPAIPDTWPLEARMAEMENYPRGAASEIMHGAVAQALANAGAKVVHIDCDGTAWRVVPAAEAAYELAGKVHQLKRMLAGLGQTIAASAAAIAERDRAIEAWKHAGALAKAQHAKVVADLERKLATNVERADSLEQRLRQAGERATVAERKLANAVARERMVAETVAEFGRRLSVLDRKPHDLEPSFRD